MPPSVSLFFLYHFLSISPTKKTLFLTQLLLDLGLEILGLLGTRPASLDLSIAANEELFKVPLDTLEAHEAGLFVLEPFEGGVCGCAVDLFI